MILPTDLYLDQKQRWPSSGRHLLACFDDERIVVYQAYSPSIGSFAARKGYFGGDFSYNRMSWIKPNFLWMMYRSDWGRSNNQEVILAISLRRSFFDSLLEMAVPSSFDHSLFETHQAWASAVQQSDVRLQWDPDHHPNGAKEERRAIQLGLRGLTLEAFGKQQIVEIEDISDVVASQREHVIENRINDLITPLERVYRPCESIATRIGLDPSP